MNCTTEAKNELAECRNRDQLFAKLGNLCEAAGYDYDYRRSFGSNARSAAAQSRNGVAEVIKHAELLEQRL